ncbi:venom protease [Anabrus simplex]|uniref:venom protease n=1 Tax=Anabrus simplex TaxID=316456 RepID=UPI0035A2962E
MTMSVLWYYLLALSLWIIPGRCFPMQLDEDQDCSLPGGIRGVCSRISRCSPVLAALRSGSLRSTVRCGFLGFEEIVCCPSNIQASNEDELEETAPKRENRQQHGGIRKSQQACQQYRENEVKRIGYFILNGEEAMDGEFPHMAALGFLVSGETTISWRCGGSLISDRFVLTAAHCVTDRRLGYPKMVRLGQNDINAVSTSGSDYPIDRVILHPGYKKKFNYDDIALVRLTRPVKFSQNISPACLYTKEEDPSTELIATGWGATDSGGFTQSSRLLKTTVSSFPHDSCQNNYKRMSKLPEGVRKEMLCAGDPSGRSDTCQGDSGGPLQILENSSSSVYSVVGVTSFGPSPCGGKKPSIYTRVSSYLDWIEGIVW